MSVLELSIVLMLLLFAILGSGVWIAVALAVCGFAAVMTKLRPYWLSLPPPPTVVPSHGTGFREMVGLFRLMRSVVGAVFVRAQNEMSVNQFRLMYPAARSVPMANPA